ncbi:unnamed protein product [Amoebophrya sp. A25]|nr:unnamed protein product [Amoebophrya sp. A25]|eukprot:GSA25T00006633001.1
MGSAGLEQEVDEDSGTCSASSNCSYGRCRIRRCCQILGILKRTFVDDLWSSSTPSSDGTSKTGAGEADESSTSSTKSLDPVTAEAKRKFYSSPSSSAISRTSSSSSSGSMLASWRGPVWDTATDVCTPLVEPSFSEHALAVTDRLENDMTFQTKLEKAKKSLEGEREGPASKVDATTASSSSGSGVGSGGRSPGPDFSFVDDIFAALQLQTTDHENKGSTRGLMNHEDQFQDKCLDFVRKRGYFLDSPFSEEEASFPLAYILLVHREIAQLERLLRAIWHRQNHYCIHVDVKASPAFRNQVRALVHCLNIARGRMASGVVGEEKKSTTTSSSSSLDVAYPSAKEGSTFLVSDPVAVYYASYTRVEADLRCLNDLAFVDYKYVVNLCGQDYPLKTNLELVRDFKALNGRGETFSVDPNWEDKLWRVREYWQIKPRYRAWINNERSCDGEEVCRQRKEHAKELDRDWRKFLRVVVSKTEKDSLPLPPQASYLPESFWKEKDEQASKTLLQEAGNTKTSTAASTTTSAVAAPTSASSSSSGQLALLAQNNAYEDTTFLERDDSKARPTTNTNWFGSPLGPVTGLFIGGAYYALPKPMMWIENTYSPDEMIWATLVRHWPWVPGSFSPHRDYDLTELRARSHLINFQIRSLRTKDFAQKHDPVQTQGKYFLVKFLYNYVIRFLLGYGEAEMAVIQRRGIVETLAKGANWNFNPFLAEKVFTTQNPVCRGKYVRGACVYGAMDLPWIRDQPHWIANKFDHRFDAMPIHCLDWKNFWSQRMNHIATTTRADVNSGVAGGAGRTSQSQTQENPPPAGRLLLSSGGNVGNSTFAGSPR